VNGEHRTGLLDIGIGTQAIATQVVIPQGIFLGLQTKPGALVNAFATPQGTLVMHRPNIKWNSIYGLLSGFAWIAAILTGSAIGHVGYKLAWMYRHRRRGWRRKVLLTWLIARHAAKKADAAPTSTSTDIDLYRAPDELVHEAMQEFADAVKPHRDR
jgi:hypothetical protein